MTAQTAGRIRRIYGILLSFSIIISGICLMAACLGIYDSGNGEFTREAVAAAFSPIAGAVYLCLVLVLLGFPLNLLLPAEETKLKPGSQNRAVLRRLHRKTDLDACSDSICQAVTAQQRIRKRHLTVTLVLLAVTAAVFLGYVLTGDRFLLPDITASMEQAMLVLLPCLAVSFGYSIFAHYRSEKSILKEIVLMKQASKEAPVRSEAKAEPAAKRNLNTLRAAILLLAVAVMLLGYFTGGTADVLTKAINICTECVGLG